MWLGRMEQQDSDRRRVAVPSRRSRPAGARCVAMVRAGPGAGRRPGSWRWAPSPAALLGFFAYIVGARHRRFLHPAVLRPGAGRRAGAGRPARGHGGALPAEPGRRCDHGAERRCAALRMALAEEGMPVGGTVGYELLDGPTRSPPATFWPTSICGGRSRASSPAPSARCAASARRGCTSWCPSAACSAASEREAHRLDRPGAARRRARSTSARSPASASWWRPRCRASPPRA